MKTNNTTLELINSKIESSEGLITSPIGECNYEEIAAGRVAGFNYKTYNATSDDGDFYLMAFNSDKLAVNTNGVSTIYFSDFDFYELFVNSLSTVGMIDEITEEIMKYGEQNNLL